MKSFLLWARSHFRKIIVSAAPTCTLWVPNMVTDHLEFRFYRGWKISRREIDDLTRRTVWSDVSAFLRSALKRRAANLLSRLIISELVENGYHRDTAQRVVRREVGAISDDCLQTFAWEKSEQRIMEDRLNRRFDLGSSLNEAANRAMAQKASERGQPKDDGLSGPQRAALAFQKQYLEKIVRNS